MTKFLVILLFIGNAFAGEATFTWSKPIPAFSDPSINPAWIIHEYRIYCDIVDLSQQSQTYNKTVTGYDTETVTFNDIPAGVMTCRMTSFSRDSGTESIYSNSVTKTIGSPAPGAPSAPTVFDFLPAIVQQINPGGGDIITDTTYRLARGVSYKVRCKTVTDTDQSLSTICKKVAN